LLLSLTCTLAASCVDASVKCPELSVAAQRHGDASRALGQCLDRVPAGGRLNLKPAIYRLSQPVTISKPVTISTLGISDSSRGCAQKREGACAILLLAPDSRTFLPKAMPITVRANGVSFMHLVIRGSGSGPAQDKYCLSGATRPSGGGVRVSASGFTLRKSMIERTTCYTALEVTKGARNLTIADNVIGPNGDHSANQTVADGVTIHDAINATVSGNTFIDNTDVQLIFGGCQNCSVVSNRLRHSGRFSGASFAGLMLQSWPSTSGDFTGTVVRSNDVDCGSHRRCGYGIMIGSTPWHHGRAEGGQVIGNSVSNAQIGINVDTLSGPMEIRSNSVRNAGGLFNSDCGFRKWPAVNIAPRSNAFVRGQPSGAAVGSVDTTHCLLNRRKP